jgi:hypothetical protein
MSRRSTSSRPCHDGDNPRLKAFAADPLPTLEGHLST